jgi:hypothetical protein
MRMKFYMRICTHGSIFYRNVSCCEFIQSPMLLEILKSMCGRWNKLFMNFKISWCLIYFQTSSSRNTLQPSDTFGASLDKTRKFLHAIYVSTPQKCLPSYLFLDIPNNGIYVHSAFKLFILTSSKVIYQYIP